MKTRNLLLAGFVAVAMSACSNSEEFVDNSIQAPTGEETSMRVYFSVPANGARAVDKGTSAESKITTATIVLEYGGSKRLVKKNLTLNETPNGNQELIAATEPFVVTKGEGVKVYAFINPTADLDDQLKSKDINKITIGEQSLPTENASSLDFLTGTIAKADNFLMSGFTTIDIKADKDVNEAIIKVNRVSAKLEEETLADKPFELSNGRTTEHQESIKLRFVEHSYSNLVKDSYLMGQTTSWTAESPFLQPFNVNSYIWITTNITYCLENIVTEGKWNQEKTTNVHYKAQVYFNDLKAATFYVKKFIKDNGDTEEIVYKSWADLKKKYTNLVDEIDATPDYLKANEITKYEDGICYYVAPIQHTGKGCTIIRNNWYKLEVTTVNDLGWPTQNTPDPEEIAKLKVTATIQPWTIHKNNIGL